MQNPIVKTEPSFDVSILAGTKSPNTIAQYENALPGVLGLRRFLRRRRGARPPSPAGGRTSIKPATPTPMGRCIRTASAPSTSAWPPCAPSWPKPRSRGTSPTKRRSLQTRQKPVLVADEERRKTGARTAIAGRHAAHHRCAGRLHPGREDAPGAAHDAGDGQMASPKP